MTALSDENDDVIALSTRQHGEVMQKMEKVIESLRGIQLIPTTLMFLVSSGYFFYIDKLPVWMWGGMQIIIMTPHFGEGVKMIIPMFSKLRNEK